MSRMCNCARSRLVENPINGSIHWEKLCYDHIANQRTPKSEDDFLLFTTLRWVIRPDSTWPPSPAWERKFLDDFPLKLHIDRLRASAQAFGWDKVLERLETASCEQLLWSGMLTHMKAQISDYPRRYPDEISLIKMRVTVSRDGAVEISSTPQGALKPPIYPLHFQSNPFQNCSAVSEPWCKVYLPPSPTEPSLFTQHKTTFRPMYAAAHNQAKLHVEPPVYCEVFIYNTSEEIMEAAVSTVYFNRGDKWFTPSSKCGGNLGTTRAWALSQEWCMEGVVTVSKVRSMHGHIVWLSNAMRGFWMARICIDEQEWDGHLKESRVLLSAS